MAEQSFIQVRVDNTLKQDATDILDEIGIDMPNAIRMFLKRIVLERGLPFDVRLPDNRSEEGKETMMFSVEKIPAKPSLHISMDEYINILCHVPAGKVTRYIDIEAYLKKVHGTNRITIDWDTVGYRLDLPFWRVLSTRGMLQDSDFLCSKERQQQMLESEGFSVVPCGARNRSLKVDNYQDYLFDFNSIPDSPEV